MIENMRGDNAERFSVKSKYSTAVPGNVFRCIDDVLFSEERTINNHAFLSPYLIMSA
jgi:hypothetical protein